MVLLFLVPADVSLPTVKNKIRLEANSDSCKSCFAFLPFDQIPRSLLFLWRYKSEKCSALQLQLSSQFFEQQMSQTHNLLFYSIIKRALRSSLISAGFRSSEVGNAHTCTCREVCILHGSVTFPVTLPSKAAVQQAHVLTSVLSLTFQGQEGRVLYCCLHSLMPTPLPLKGEWTVSQEPLLGLNAIPTCVRK